MFGWAAGSRWRAATGWLLRSIIIVAVALVVYVVAFNVVLPLVLDR
jgi:t-SNARE complex subunit (syntaxin)